MKVESGHGREEVVDMVVDIDASIHTFNWRAEAIRVHIEVTF